MSSCLFCNIVAGKIESDLVYQEDDLIAFRDIRPQAPIHLLIIPRQHIATINDVQSAEEQILVGKMIAVARQLAYENGIQDEGYRLVFNVNSHAGQEVYHIHLHLLAGRPMTWPPG